VVLDIVKDYVECPYLKDKEIKKIANIVESVGLCRLGGNRICGLSGSSNFSDAGPGSEA